MSDLKIRLSDLVSTKGGNMVYFGRWLAVSYPDIFDEVMNNTPFLSSKAKFNERVYAIINDIQGIPACPLNGEPLRFVNYFKGYRTASMQGKRERQRKIRETPKPLSMQSAALLEYAAIVGSDEISVGSKIKKLLNRNKKECAELYDLPQEAEGIDFVVCPVLKIRMLNIRRTHIENVLRLSLDEFNHRYPDAKTVCSGFSKRISTGLKVETETGLTKHASSVEKATVSRNKVGNDGLTVNQRKGIKTRATHMKKDEDGFNGYQRIAKFRNETIQENGLSVQQNSLIKRFETLLKMEKANSRASKISIKVLQPLLDFIKEGGYKYYFDISEFGVQSSEGYFFYDLVVPYFSMCVEYQSNAFHPNPFWSSEEWNRWKHPFVPDTNPDDRLQYDLRKAKCLWEKRSISTWFVWETTQHDDVAQVLSYMKEFQDVII